MIKLFSFLMAVFAMASLPLLAEKVGLEVQDVTWTDRPPVLDGVMDDECWQSAPVITDFLSLSDGDLPQRTEVRVTYDARNLYIFWRAFEANEGRLPRISQEPGRDRLDRKESVEVMFYPDISKPDWRMFVAAPSAWRYDSSSRDGEAYNPHWQFVAGRFAGVWTAEARIPFGELATPGQLIGTPQPGDIWGADLYRKTSQPFHVSGRGPDAPQMKLRFAGQPGAPVVSASLPFSAWEGAVKVLVTGASSAIVGECRIVQAGALFDTQKLELSAPDERRIAEARTRASKVQESLEFPFRFTDGGEVRFKFDLISDGRTIYSGQAVTSLLSVSDIAREINEVITNSREALTQKSLPESEKLIAEVDQFEERLRRATSHPEQMPDLALEWKELRRQLNLARLYPKNALQFAVGAVTESDKIYPDTLYEGSLDAPINLSLAGNEYGSFQLVVIPFWKDLKDVAVTFSELRGPDGKVIPAENIRCFRVGYIKLEEAPGFANVKYEHDHEPDPLLPAKPFDVDAKTVAAIWVDVLVPEGTPEGVFVGTATISANGQQVARKIEIHSNGFDIPKRSSLEVNNWFMPDYGWETFYGGIDYTPELHAKHAKILGSYRVDSFPTDMDTLCKRVPITAEPDGHFTFDWTEFDKYVSTALANGTNTFWSALSCNSGWTYYLNTPGTPVFDQKTGKTLTIAHYMQAKWDAYNENEEVARLYGKAQYENPIYREFLVAYVQHLKDLGIAESSYYELFDEANQDPPPHMRWESMIEHHKFFRELVPDLQLLNLGFDPLQEFNGKSAVGLHDAWAPHLFEMDNVEIFTSILERRKQHGEKFWAYSCTEKQDKEGNYTPFLLYHRPYLSVRMNYWMAWKYQFDGYLLYMTNDKVPEINAGKSVEERWPNSEWSDGAHMGSGTLVYPGPDYELIPGMRLANARDGLQDYEYFVLLRKESQKLDAEKNKELLERVERALVIEPEIITSVYKWTKDPEQIYAKRAELAALIKEVKKAQE